jgi:hypothetical protein
VSYYAHIKEAEIARYRKETTAKSDEVQTNEAHVSEDVTEWEHREYFDMF